MDSAPSHVFLPAGDTEQRLAEVPAPNKTPPARFAFVDGLRGLAALGIVVFHVWSYEPDPYPTVEIVPWVFNETFRHAKKAVQILLVISGFVIAFTLRNSWFNWREVSSFVGRRFVRLVPPYWVTIAFVIAVYVVCRSILGTHLPFDGDISVARVMAHMTFLQGIVGHDSLSAGIWTISIEMQFYVVAVLGWGLAQRLFPRPDRDRPRPSALALTLVFVPLAVISLFYWRPDDTTEEWVIHYFWMFFLGMVTWWALDGTLPRIVFVTTVLIGLINLYFDSEYRYLNAVALATALAIYVAGRMDRLHVWLNWWPLQYLGRVSYSLYLIHFPVTHLWTATGWKWCDNSPSPLLAAFILLTAIAISIPAAHVLYVFVEAPSSKLAARLKRT